MFDSVVSVFQGSAEKNWAEVKWNHFHFCTYLSLFYSQINTFKSKQMDCFWSIFSHFPLFHQHVCPQLSGWTLFFKLMWEQAFSTQTGSQTFLQRAAAEEQRAVLMGRMWSEREQPENGSLCSDVTELQLTPAPPRICMHLHIHAVANRSFLTVSGLTQHLQPDTVQHCSENRQRQKHFTYDWCFHQDLSFPVNTNLKLNWNIPISFL